jgi:hypothetical protein
MSSSSVGLRTGESATVCLSGSCLSGSRTYRRSDRRLPQPVDHPAARPPEVANSRPTAGEHLIMVPVMLPSAGGGGANIRVTMLTARERCSRHPSRPAAAARGRRTHGGHRSGRTGRGTDSLHRPHPCDILWRHEALGAVTLFTVRERCSRCGSVVHGAGALLTVRERCSRHPSRPPAAARGRRTHREHRPGRTSRGTDSPAPQAASSPSDREQPLRPRAAPQTASSPSDRNQPSAPPWCEQERHQVQHTDDQQQVPIPGQQRQVLQAAAEHCAQQVQPERGL